MRFLFVYVSEKERKGLQCISGARYLPREFKTKDMLKLMAYFQGTENAKVIVNAKFVLTGFNLPADTIIIRSKSFDEQYGPESPERIQLDARVGRVRGPKTMVLVSGTKEENLRSLARSMHPEIWAKLDAEGSCEDTLEPELSWSLEEAERFLK